jgi:aspartyl-tRNA(Asn)/glutamyl-tRNA(Gln) amidotransferase subunit A
MPNVMASSPLTPQGPQVDVLLHPSAIRTAPYLASSKAVNSNDATEASGLDAYTQDVLTVPASLAGLPALSIPAELAGDGWPLGVTIVGQWGSDHAILAVGQYLQDVIKGSHK